MPFPNPATQFKAGNHANDAGRPKGSTVTAELVKRLNEVEPQSQLSYSQLVARAVILEAMKGNGAALRILFDRTEGTAPQSIDLTSGGEALGKVVIYLPDNGRDAPGEGKRV